MQKVGCRLPGSSVHGIFQAWILEWVAISYSRGSSRARDRTSVSHLLHWHADSLPRNHLGSPNIPFGGIQLKPQTLSTYLSLMHSCIELLISLPICLHLIYLILQLKFFFLKKRVSQGHILACLLKLENKDRYFLTMNLIWMFHFGKRIGFSINISMVLYWWLRW